MFFLTRVISNLPELERNDTDIGRLLKVWRERERDGKTERKRRVTHSQISLENPESINLFQRQSH